MIGSWHMVITWIKVRVVSSSITFMKNIGTLTWFGECSIEVGDDVVVGDESCVVCGPVSWEELSICLAWWIIWLRSFNVKSEVAGKSWSRKIRNGKIHKYDHYLNLMKSMEMYWKKLHLPRQYFFRKWDDRLVMHSCNPFWHCRISRKYI